MVGVDPILCTIPWHQTRWTLEPHYASAKRSIGMRHTRFAGIIVTNLSRFKFFDDEAMIAIKVCAVVIFLRRPISDETHCYFNLHFPMGLNLNFVNRTLWRKAFRIGPVFKFLWINRPAIYF